MDNRFVFKKANVQAPAIRPLQDYLVEQDNILNELSQVISREYEALKDRKVSSLKPLSEQKSHLMVKLQSNDQKIKLHPQVALLKTQFQDFVKSIKEKMKSCKYKNDVNGSLITMNMQSNHKLYALLIGVRDMATKNMTYSNKGYAQAKGPTRLSVQA